MKDIRVDNDFSLGLALRDAARDNNPAMLSALIGFPQVKNMPADGLLSFVSLKHDLLQKEAEKVFSNVVVAEDFKKIHFPK